MNRAQALAAVKEKREQIKSTFCSEQKISTKERNQLRRDLFSCQGVIDDLDDGLPFSIKEGFLSTHSAKIKL